MYRLELDGRCTQVLTGLTISNGIGWSPDATTMYLADSGTGDVYAFDFDPATGDLGRRRTIAHISTPNAAPDGLTVDHQGNIWVALWNGGALARYHPDGSLLDTIPLPVDRPTSCAFGDTGGGTLFVTTARDGLDDAALGRQPDAGRLLRVDSLGVTGPPCEPCRGYATAASDPLSLGSRHGGSFCRSTARPSARTRAPGRAAGIYGTSITAPILAEIGDHVHTLPLTVSILVTLVVYWRAAQLRAGSCSQITFRWTWSGTCPRNRRVLLDAVQERRG